MLEGEKPTMMAFRPNVMDYDLSDRLGIDICWKPTARARCFSLFIDASITVFMPSVSCSTDRPRFKSLGAWTEHPPNMSILQS